MRVRRQCPVVRDVLLPACPDPHKGAASCGLFFFGLRRTRKSIDVRVLLSVLRSVSTSPRAAAQANDPAVKDHEEYAVYLRASKIGPARQRISDPDYSSLGFDQ